MEPAVARAFERALSSLSAQGAHIVELTLAELRELAALNRRGGLATAEAYAIHREWLDTHASAYDPRVRTRILRGKEQHEDDYHHLLNARADFISRVTQALEEFDALLMPTVPIIAPPIAALAEDEAYARMNMLVLRNPSIINFIDGCAISIPCHDPGAAPVGLMIAALSGRDDFVLRIARSAEQALGRIYRNEHN